MEKQKLSNKLLLQKIIIFSKPFRSDLIKIFYLILLIAAIDGLGTFSLSHVFDIIQKHGNDKVYFMQAVLYTCGAGLALFVRHIILNFQQNIEIKKIDLKIQNYLNHASISKFFSFSNGQHINEHSGVKQAIVTAGVTSIQNQITLYMYQFFPAVAQIIISFIILFYISWVIGFIFIITALLFSWLMYNNTIKTVPGIRKIREQRIKNSRLSSELYRFVTLIKNENQEERSLSDLNLVQERQQTLFEETWLPAMIRYKNIRMVMTFMRYLALFTLLYLLFFTSSISVGNFFMILTYSSMFINCLWMLMDIYKQFLLDKVNIEKYFELLEVQPDIKVVENPIFIKALFGKIEFKDVSFSYPTRSNSYDINTEISQEDPVIRNISFTINAGEKIGIVGESGSGKSTIANLIKRNFDPKSGQILIDGNDLRLIDLNSYYSHIGSIEQEVNLFDRSIRDNILFGVKDALSVTDDQLKKIAQIARIDAFFDRLEHGFDTIVGEKGVKLSGGERQRIGIARALAKNPQVLIFDEATSALDSMSERIVQESIDEACKDKTSIVIAHRLSTVKNCDRILVFRNGILLAQGTHEELLNSCEYYSELVSHQITTV